MTARHTGLPGTVPPDASRAPGTDLRCSLRTLPVRDVPAMLLELVNTAAARDGLPEFAEGIADFALWHAERRAGAPRPLAQLWAHPTWTHSANAGLAFIGRPALRTARALSALAQHLDVAAQIREPLASAVVATLRAALRHPRSAIWTRAARAMGRLAGGLPGLTEELALLLDTTGPGSLRRRAHVALGTLPPRGPRALLERRDAAFTDVTESWLIASVAVGLRDRVELPGAPWSRVALACAQRDSPEVWTAIATSLREIVSWRPDQRAIVRTVADDVLARARQYRAATPGDQESLERVLASCERLLREEHADTSTTSLLDALADRVAVDPGDVDAATLVEAFGAASDAALGEALQTLSTGGASAAARAAGMLDETVELLLDGDIHVVAERIASEGQGDRLRAHAEGLRRRLMHVVSGGLRRATPMTASWRRFLLRTMAVLPRLEPHGTDPNDRTRVVRAQVCDALVRVADDAAMQQPALQRHVLGTVTDLSHALREHLDVDASIATLTWLGLRTGVLPVNARPRRATEPASTERIDAVFRAVDVLTQPTRATPAELRSLGSLAGTRCRLGATLTHLADTVSSFSQRPEAHWSGLPRLDVGPLARLADELKRQRDDAHYALTLDEAGPAAPTGESLEDQANKLDHFLTSTSLKFLDASRRGEIVAHYVADVSGLCEAIANACGPVAGTVVRSLLARALIGLRTEAAAIARERDTGARYIARLRVLGPLSSADEGGMTNTYLAEGPAPGKRVVVKLLPWQRFPGPQAAKIRAMFEGEMAKLASIVHPNVVSIVDAGFVDEGAYIALEHIPGASLETVLRRTGAVALPRLAPIVRDAARGLAYLHSRNIAHRDVKPGNILVQFDRISTGGLTPDEWARVGFVRSVVIDLGVAADDGGRTDTAFEGVIGTPGYIPPEMARGVDSTTSTGDVYALAVVAFEALAGFNPYLEDGAEFPGILVRHGTQPLPMDRWEGARRHPEVARLLTDASQLEPSARPTMTQFVAHWTASTRSFTHET